MAPKPLPSWEPIPFIGVMGFCAPSGVARASAAKATTDFLRMVSDIRASGAGCGQLSGGRGRCGGGGGDPLQKANVQIDRVVASTPHDSEAGTLRPPVSVHS